MGVEVGILAALYGVSCGSYNVQLTPRKRIRGRRNGGNGGNQFWGLRGPQASRTDRSRPNYSIRYITILLGMRYLVQ